MDPLEIFDNFKLDTLDEKWSDEVWEREFVSFPEPPVEYSIILGSEDMEQTLRETCSALKKWIDQYKDKDESNTEERSEVSWQTFTALNINVKGLLAVLGYLLKTGQAAGADEDSRQACLASADLYFILLSIPGSSTFYVFHPNLYHRAIDALKLSEHLILPRKAHKSSDLDALYSEPHDEMLHSEKSTLIKGLNSILYELITMFKSFYMKYQSRSLEATVINLVELTKLETESNFFLASSNKRTNASISTLSYNAYVALQDLCEPRHGAIEVTVKLIMQHLMPHLCPLHLDLPLRASNVVWDTTITFLQNLLNSKGTSAEVGMEILVQQLLINCPDRSDPRQKQASVVSKLINICTGNLFLKCAQHLIKFSFQNKIPYRIFGQEVIGKLLMEALIIPCDTSESEVELRNKVRVALMATVHSRTIDLSSMVRGKAMSTIESMVNNENFSISSFLNLSEESQAFPMVNEILNALSEDSNPLPGPNTFNSMLLERIKDERALVRRSTVHILQHLVTHFPGLLEKVAPIIGQHCRDPALTVRKDSIGTLTSLLENNPQHEILLNEYVKAVLPRIYDVEVKIQEKVLESLQTLLLDKIRTFSDEEAESEQADELPWRIVDVLTMERLRKNLSKICNCWVKASVVSKPMIARIQSHIGSKHDVESWTLLLALAENMKLPNMDQHFDNFKESLEGDDFVSVVRLQVLRYCWQDMAKSHLESLARQCYESLREFKVCLESISTCIDILDGIVKQLKKPGDEEEESRLPQMVDLMRLSEVQIDKLDEEEEKVDEENIDMYLKAMSTLGHASLLCSEDVTESSLGIVQRLLLDCESEKMSEAYEDRMKAAGVVLLGQQSLRDRELAERVMPILGRLMCQGSGSESPAQAAIRINAVKALADLCIRFTALVEPYLPDMCVTMKDPDPQVREAIVLTFVQLLLEDYIKVKGAFFYHILTMLADNDETIRELTVFLIKERLLAKNKPLVAQSFVKAIFHYNSCQVKHKFSDRKIRKKERDALTLPGKKNLPKRWVIYDFLLEHLDPPSKLKILTKLNSEILEGVSEKFIDVTQVEGAGVLKDVLYIILNDRMHASFGTKQQDDDFHEEAITAEAQTSNAVNVIVEGMKKFKFRVMLPSLIKLRLFLLDAKSPMLLDVAKFFNKLLSEFNKDQIAEILDEHPNLKKDIEQDISQHREESSDSESNEEFESIKDVEKSASKEERLSDAGMKNDLKPDIPKEEELPITSPTSDKPKSVKASPRKIQDIHLNLPKIVLRRLSSLTYPGIRHWKSPPHESRVNQSSDPEPSSSGMSVSSKSTSEELIPSSMDYLAEMESSLPKPNKIARVASTIAHVQSS